MVLKRTTEYLGCFIVIFSWLFIPFVSLTAAIDITITYGGNDRILPGFINSTYDMTIRVEFTNTVDGAQDFDTYNGGNAKLLIDWAANNGDGDGFADMGAPWGSPQGIDNGIKEWTISANQIGTEIKTPSGQNPVDGYMVDFQVWHNGSGTTNQTDIDDYGAAGAITSLVFHQVAPGWTASYPQNSVFDDDGYFNTLSIKTRPNEDLLSHADYKSYIQLTGDANSDVDAGGVHRFDISGHLEDDEIETDAPQYTNAAGDAESPLVDGALYDVRYVLYDVAGNVASFNGPSNEIYDITRPTISEITTSEGADAIQKKKDDYVLFTVNFSESVKGTNSLTVTFETSTVDGQDGTGTAPYQNLASWAGTARTEKVGRFQVSTDDLSTDLSINSPLECSGTITDLAGNEMDDFTVPDGKNLNDVAEITVDGVNPSITKVESEPSTGTLSLGQSATISIYFNEVITLADNLSFKLSSDADKAETFDIGSVGVGADDDGNQVSVGQYTYTVVADDYEADALYISTGPSGTVNDLAGNEVTSLSIPGDQELRDNSTLKVETIAPAITLITTDEGTGTYGEGSAITVKVNFKNGVAGSAEPVVMGGSASGTITIGTGDAANGGTARFTEVNPALATFVTGEYVVSSTNTDGAITVNQVQVTGDITDEAGNPADLSLDNATIFAGKTLTVDVTKPAITTITTDDYTTDENPTIKFDASIKILLNTNDPVKLDLNGGSLTVTFNTGGTATVEAVGTTSALEADYKVGAGETTAGLTPERLEVESISLSGGATITDNPNYEADDPVFKPNNIAVAGLTPATGFGDGGYTVLIDGIEPYILSVTAPETDDGTYGIGDVINITVNFNEPVSSDQPIGIPISGLASNLIVPIIAQDSRVSSIEVAYTIAEGDDSDGDAIEVNGAAIKPGNALDAALNKMQDAGLTLPDDANLTDVPHLIIVDGKRPSAPQSVTLLPDGGSAGLDNGDDYSGYFNSTNTHLKVSVDFEDGLDDGTLEGGAIYLEAKIGTGDWAVLNADLNANITDDAGVIRNSYQISGLDWGGTKIAEILVALATLNTLAGGSLTHDETINVRARLIDNVGNISSGDFTTAASTLTIDTQIPNLTTISYVSTIAGLRPYLQGTDIDIRLTFDEKVTLIDGGKIIAQLNVGTPSLTEISFEKISAGASAQFGRLDASATLIGQETYTVGANDYNADELSVNGISLSTDGILRDLGGNSITASDLTTDLNGGTFTNLTGVYVDGVVPDAPTITSITTDVNIVVGNDLCNCDAFWNDDNDNATFALTLEKDPSMTEGKVYILARTGNSAYEEVGSAREDITIAESNNNGNDPNIEIIITIPEPTFDAKSWWPNSLVQGAAAGDVDFKIRSEDYAGNTTDSEDVSKKIIHVDEIDPSVLTIVTLETTVNNNNGNSIAQQGYWNIDTDKLRVTLSDMSEPNTDDNVVGGKVQLQGKVSDKDWTNLGLVKTITDANRTGFYIDVEDTEAGVGIEELQGADSWDDMNGEFIQIRAVVFDEAGNSSTWENQTNFQNPTNSPYIRIDGTKEAHRPLITNVTSDKTTGWWGHDSDDNTISIQITAQDKDDLGNLNPEIVPITVTGGTPSIQLEIGPEDGVATYTSGSGQNELVFQYTIGENHTSIGNLPDGDLQFKLIPNNAGEAIIDLNTADMHSAAGNLLLTGDDNPTSPLLPTPGTTGSLSKNKDLYIDGVDPYEVYVSGSEFDQKAMTIGGIIAKGTEQRPGYYNYRTSTIGFTIYFRNTTDLITITQLGNEDAEVDLSLALTPDPDCNRALVECGSIQLLVGVADIGETPTDYTVLGPAIPINYSAVVDKGTGLINDDGGSEDDAHQIITYNASPTTAIVEAGDFEALPGVLDISNDFVEGVELSFKAEITDLAGNQTTTEIYGTIITVDQTPPADGSLTPNNTDDDMITGSVVTNAPFPDINVVSGFWNSHNTGLRLTAPLPAGDPTLVGGAVLIAGKKSGNDTYDQLGYTITTVDAVTGEHTSNDLYDVSFNITQGEYDSGDPKTVPLPYDPNFPQDGWLEDGNYLFVEDITDYADGENLSFAARVFDVAGNYTDWAESTTSLKVDLTAPTVTEVTSLNDNLAYDGKDGIDNNNDGVIDEDSEEDELIYISVVASEYMRNVGTGLDNSSLELNAGGSSNLAFFRGIGQQLVPNKDTLYYTYNIKADESSEDVDFPDGEWLLPNILVNHPTDDLNYVSISSLVINPNTGGLTDLAGNDLNRDLPPVGDDNALAQKKNIVIDTYAPKVTYSYFEETADGASSTVVEPDNDSEKLVSFNNEYLRIRARFNDSIQVDIKPTLAIDFPDGTVLPAAEMWRTLTADLPVGTDPYPAATSNFEYDYILTLIDNVDGNITITPTAYDKANNLIDPDAGQGIVVIDNTEPVFTDYCDEGIVDHDTKTLCDAGAAAHNDGLEGHFITLLSPVSNSFVNTSVVSYTLSEDVFSGSITWTGTSGDDNGVIHEIELTSACDETIDGHDTKTLCDDGAAVHSDGKSGHFTTELLAFDNEDLALTNDMDDLVDGSYYDISWSALDSADNPSPENISTRVLYDVTPPIVYIDYKFDVVQCGYNDTICWVHFNERVNPDPDYKPKISIQFLDDPTTTTFDEGTALAAIVDADMTIFSKDGVDDSTKWFYVRTEGIPFVFDSRPISCATNVTITAEDLAGNLLPPPLNRCDEGIVGHDSKALCDAGALDHSDGLDGHYVRFNGCDEGIVDHDTKTLCDAGAADHSDGFDGHFISNNTFDVTGSNNQDTLNYDILRLNFKEPICTLSYINPRDSLLTDDPGDYSLPTLAHGKSGDSIRVIAKLNDEFGKPPEHPNPTLNVHFSYLEITDTDYYSFDSSSSDADLISIYQHNQFIDDSMFVWTLVLPDSVHGPISITVNGTDRALNKISDYQGFEFVVDNIFPDSLATGTVAGRGTPTPPPRWLNGITDSISVVVPIPSTDQSLTSSPSGNIHIELRNLAVNPNLSVPIPRLRTMTADSITGFGLDNEFFRTFTEILDGITNMTPSQSLSHRDSISIQAAVSDRVGNKRKYTTSTTILHYDQHKPIVSEINGGNVYSNGDDPLPLISSDTLSAEWSASYDIFADGDSGSGISGYDYMIYEHDSVGNNIDTLLSWISNGQSEEVIVTDLGLVHKRGYSFSVRAVDRAGNVSDTVASNIIYRFNTPPIISIDSLISALEDIEYKVPIEVTDPDTATVLYDRFYYHGYGKNGLGWFQWYPPRDDDSVYFHELGNDPVINNAGFITWTPTAWDTGDHQIRLMVKDSSDLWDTLDYTMEVLPMNDPPFFRYGTDFEYTYGIDPYNEDVLEMPDITIEEDQAESLRVDMTQYIYDEDNDDTTDITWSGVWSEQDVNAGYLYPRTSLFFGPGTPEIFKERMRAQYLPQRNTVLSEHQFQSELKTVVNRTSYKSIAEKSIVFHNTPDGDYAMIKGSPDYYGQNDTIIFFAIDMLTRPASSPFDTFGFDRDTVFITVNAVNDNPYWSDTSKFGIDDTAPILADTMMMMENDTLALPLYSYARDIDNDWLNFTIQVTTYGSTNEPNPVDSMTTNPKENVVRKSDGDSTDIVMFIPDTTWTEIAKIRVTATDSALLDSSIEFYIDVHRAPRPKIVFDVIQNNIFDTYFDIIVTDTIEKAIAMEMELDGDGNFTPMAQLDSFTYHYRHKAGMRWKNQPGSPAKNVKVRAKAFSQIGSVLNKHFAEDDFTYNYIYADEEWSLTSPEGSFKVTAEAGAVNMDQIILLVDSTMFKKGYSGSYKLGDEVRVFNKPVEVSMASYDEGLALYQRNTNNTWTELPSFNEQGRIRAYTDKMGYFRLGRKTLIVPGLTSLGQNYPNPFNPVTNITYDVGFVDGPDQQVNLSIYNLLGQQVITLVNDQRSIGRHKVKWYGKDKSGISVASGMYFVHMVTSTGKVQTKKVMLLR